MIPILTITDFENEIKNRNENKIVGLMFAPYNRNYIKEIVNQYYQEWHYLSGKEFNMFWIGYSKFKNHEKVEKVDINENLFFDLELFVNEQKRFNNKVTFTYNNDYELILFKCHKGIINYNNHIRIELDEYCFTNNHYDLRHLIQLIINGVQVEGSFDNLKKRIKRNRNLIRLKKVNVIDVMIALKELVA